MKKKWERFMDGKPVKVRMRKARRTKGDQCPACGGAPRVVMNLAKGLSGYDRVCSKCGNRYEAPKC